MLHRVGMGQVRFNVPGLSADARGVVVGRQIVLRFSTLDRLVSFLRLWSNEQVLDDLRPGPRLLQARVSGGAREALMIFDSSSLARADSAARVARTVGGQCFTGAGKHFVQFRDGRAPLGYDVAALEPTDAAIDFVLYAQEHALSYAVLGELPLDKLLLQLDLQRQPPGAASWRDLLYLTARRGLGPLLVGYLHRAQMRHPTLRASAALCEPPAEGAFQKAAPFWIFRLEHLPQRMVGVLSRTPGLTLLAPVADNVAVALGYRHPVHLGSCKQVFAGQRMTLFRPAPAGVTVIDPAPTFAPLAALVRLRGGDDARSFAEAAGGARPGGPRRPDEPRPSPATPIAVTQDLVVPLRLQAVPGVKRRPVAALVPWARLGWLRTLCYAMPPSVLRGHRLAAIPRGLLVIASDVLAGFPFGQLFHAPAPGLLVPLGWEFRPAVDPAELASRVQAGPQSLLVFPEPRGPESGPDGEPFRIPAASLETLEARVLGDPRLDQIRLEQTPGPPPVREPHADVEIENQPLGAMPLWRLPR